MGGQEPTVEEYKAFVKDLKLKIKRLQEKNKELVSQVVTLKSNLENRYGKPDCNAAVTVSKRVTKIQSIWRGIIARRKFKQALRKALADKPQEKAMTNQTVMIKAKEAAEKINMNLEMIYRAADCRMSGAVFLDEFRILLQRLKLPLSPSQMARFVYLIDEDCLGVLRKEDYNLTLAAYGVNSEPDYSDTSNRTFEQQ